MRRLACTLACLLAVACGLDGNVGQGGEYTFLPGADVVDTADRPLSHLLVIEEDAAANEVRFYAFSGELSAAGLGLADLRRLATRQGRYDMAFEATLAGLDLEDVDRDEGPGLEVGDAELHLSPLDEDTLDATRARRFLRTLDTQDYDVSAHFARLDAPGDSLGALSWPDAGLRFTPTLAGAPLAFELEDGEEGGLVVRYGELPGADYLVVELLQRILPIADEGDAGVDEPEAIEAMVRTSLSPGGEYRARPALFTDVFGQGCWSRERAVTARLWQVARTYVAGEGRDHAIIHRRSDALRLAPERWLDALGEPEPPGYCDDYETPEALP